MIYIQKTILLGTLSVIYTQNDIIKDPFYDLHTKNDIIMDPFCNTTYKPTSFDKDEILANHRSFMTSLTFPLVKSLRIYPIYIGYLNSIRHHTKKGT